MNNRSYKILIVDDEPDILEFIQYNLRKEGYFVYTAKNGEEAVALAKQEVPHLIVMDIMMPVMDGVEACRIMRTIPALNKTYLFHFVYFHIEQMREFLIKLSTYFF